MPDQNLIRLMRSVGLAVFVECFDTFADSRLTNQEAADLLPHEYKLTARLTRVSCARRIIDQGLTRQALEIISQSKRVDAATSRAAVELLSDM